MIVYAQLIGARLSQSSYKTVLSCGALSGVNRCKVISFLFRYRYQRRALIDSARARRKNKPAKQKRFGVYGDAHWWRDHQALILILVSFLPLMRLIVLLLLFSYFWSTSKEKSLLPGSTLYKEWRRPTERPSWQFYVYNWSNAQAILEHQASSASFQEIGPFQYEGVYL